jgi:hypothetical protein
MSTYSSALGKSIDRGCILEDARAVSIFPPANRHFINIKIPASGIVINEKGNIPLGAVE